jgi:NAD-dependent deacetylase
VRCSWRCGIDEAHAQIDAGITVPLCGACEGWLKPATVSFGQTLPAGVFAEAEELSGVADVFLALGSSLLVYPAASLPELAARRGAYFVIANREATPLDGLAAATVRAPLGEVFSLLRTALLDGGMPPPSSPAPGA